MTADWRRKEEWRAEKVHAGGKYLRSLVSGEFSVRLNEHKCSKKTNKKKRTTHPQVGVFMAVPEG